MKEFINTMSMEIEQHRCRICLEYCTETISAHDQVADGVSYLDINFKLTNQLKLDGSSNEHQHICAPCATMAKSAYSIKEPCDEADYKLEFNEEIITEEKVKAEKIEYEEIYIVNKNEQIFETSLEDKNVPIEEALELCYDEPRAVHKLEELQCDYCEYVPESLNDYTKHVEAEHADKRTKNCNYCDQSFFDTRALNDHLRNHSNTYECYDCGSKFAIKNRLAKHLKGHEQRKSLNYYNHNSTLASQKCEAYENKAGQVDWSPYACKLCDKKFKRPTTLRQHSKAVHNSHDKECFFCTFLPKSRKELINHIKQEHADKKPWACSECGKTFFQLMHLKCHLLTHKAIKATRHMCNICDFKAHFKSEMVQHMRKHTGEKPFSCLKCGKKFSKLCNLKRHKKTHEWGDSDTSDNETENLSKSVGQKTLDTYFCEICNKEFAHHSSLRRHSEDMHYIQISCCYCAYTPISTMDSEIHVQRKHADKKYFACDKCDGAFTSVRTLKSHLLRHDGTKNYECKICNYKCTFKSILANHLKKHTGEKPFQCSNCGKAFKHYNTMRIHLANQRCKRKIREDNPKNKEQAAGTPGVYACKVCDETFSSRAFVRQHTRNAHKINDTSCYFCDYVPASRNYLSKHLEKEHADKKTISCKQCDKTFFDDTNLASHLVVHSTVVHNTVNHVCKICGYKFAMKSHLIEHMIIHSAKNPNSSEIGTSNFDI